MSSSTRWKRGDPASLGVTWAFDSRVHRFVQLLIRLDVNASGASSEPRPRSVAAPCFADAHGGGGIASECSRLELHPALRRAGPACGSVESARLTPRSRPELWTEARQLVRGDVRRGRGWRRRSKLVADVRKKVVLVRQRLVFPQKTRDLEFASTSLSFAASISRLARLDSKCRA
jgi:hypothetical protein